MKNVVILSLMVFGATVVTPTLASAQAERAAEPAVESVDAMSMGDVRSKSSDWLIPPDGTANLGVGLSFLTADGDLRPLFEQPRFRFTDMVLLRLSGRYAVGDVAEIALSTTLLPKQPSFTDELAWQSATLGFRLGLADHFATSLRVKGGPTINQDGAWAGAALGLDGRFNIDRYIVFDTGLYGQGTAVSIDDKAPWFIEVVANFQIVLANPGYAATWVGIDFAFPVAQQSPDDIDFDQQTRASVNIGGALSFVDDWDIWAKFAYIDRGDIVDPSTILPILDGGFDQQQLSIGVTYRFGADD